MYEAVSDFRPRDKTRLFIETCTAMVPTPENMNLVRSATTLVRNVLDGSDIKPLREFLARAQEWCNDVDDVLAAAGQTVIDEMDTLARVPLHDLVRRVAQIERDALLGSTRRDMSGALYSVYAG